MSLTKFTFLLLAGCFIGLTSFTNHPSTDKTINNSLEPFTHIQMSGAYDVEIIQGETHAIEFDGHKYAEEAFIVTVKNGHLRVALRESVKYIKDVLVKITVQNLESITASGAHKITSKDKLTADNLELKISGATTMVLEVEANNIDATASGVSKTTLSGNTNSLCFKLSGVSKLNTYELEANVVNLSISGASNANVTSNDELDIKASGVSKVNYKGDPGKLEKKVTGASRIKKI